MQAPSANSGGQAVGALVNEMVTLVTPDRITGEPRRFACSCGVHTFEPSEAMMHAFAGMEEPNRHGVFIERFGRGRWFFDRKPMVERIIERLRHKGESMPDFARRIARELNAAMDRLDQLAREEEARGHPQN